ncbi:MAG: histidinol-phosphate transaminase [Actinomycetota bacterium]|nr:histidinol-phosphate transaminase [Actinomycetota bacterium]
MPFEFAPSVKCNSVPPAFEFPIRDDLRGVISYGAPQLAVPVCLNVNENPFPLPADVVEAITAAVRSVATDLNRYPLRDAVVLRQTLADYLAGESGAQVPWGQIWAANGSNEVMHHLFLAFGGPGRLAISFDPTYSMYPEYARDTFTSYLSFPRRADFTIDIASACRQIVSHRPSLILVTAPNNPTGTALDPVDLKTLLSTARECGAMLIVDEAYAEFRRAGIPSALELLPDFANLVVTRTMSKAFGLAGARLGYAVTADPAVVATLSVVRLPYHLSSVTQAVAIAALRHSDSLQAQVATIRRERDALQEWLIGQGFEAVRSDANFILFGTFADRQGIWQRLLDQGVLIRVTGPTGYLRVSIGTPVENDRFRAALVSAVAKEG